MDTLRLNNILRQSPYLTKQNFSLAAGKHGENLNYWIKKLLREKTLISLKKGFYISSYYLDIVSQDLNSREVYFEYLANILRFPSYVSLEYVLSSRNFLAETVFVITSVTVKSSRVYESQAAKFAYRNIKEKLFTDFSFKEFGERKVKIATLPKALFDFLYFKKFVSASETRAYLTSEGRFNWEVVTFSEKREFIRLVNSSGVKKMQLTVSILRKAKIL